MELIRINKVVEIFGVSSRTLRYYEEKGLLWCQHPENKAQRYYDESALERLKQIIVLRKFQIPIKDIIAIFDDESTSALIQAFVDKLESLDIEITALSELRRIVDDFLHEMLMSGVRKMSAIPLLYEETEKRLTISEENEIITFEKLSETSRRALRLHEVKIIRLNSMRMLTSRLRTGQIDVLDLDKMQNLFSCYGFEPKPSFHNCFLRKKGNDEWIMMIEIPPNYENQTPYKDEVFNGGLYATASCFMDDIDITFTLLREWVDKNDDFEIRSGIEMIEEILPWDIAVKLSRFQQDVYLPIKIKEVHNFD